MNCPLDFLLNVLKQYDTGLGIIHKSIIFQLYSTWIAYIRGIFIVPFMVKCLKLIVCSMYWSTLTCQINSYTWTCDMVTVTENRCHDSWQWVWWWVLHANKNTLQQNCQKQSDAIKKQFKYATSKWYSRKLNVFAKYWIYDVILKLTTRKIWKFRRNLRGNSNISLNVKAVVKSIQFWAKIRLKF